VALEDLDERGLHDAARLAQRLELGALHHAQPDEQPDADEQDREQERDPPAVAVEFG